MLKKFLKKFKKKNPTPKAKSLSPKELATQNKEPWVEVIKVHVNPDDPRNGFFELDWNSYHIEKLRLAGYKGSTDEEIIDNWFKELCNAVVQEDEDMSDFLSRPKVQSQRNDDGTVEYS